MVPSRKGFLVGYLGQNIYKIYFPETGKIQQLRDITIIEDDQLLATLLPDQETFSYPDFASNEVSPIL